MKKYSKFKNTNIEWIGEIPEHWDIIRFKYIVSSQKGKVPKKLTDKNVSNSPVYLSMSYLRGNPDEKKFVLESKDCVHVKTGDILLLWDGSEAGEFIKGKEGVLSSTMSKLDIDDDLNQSYIWYFLKTFEKILKDFTNGMGIPHVDSSILENSKIILPPLSEQIQISSYLNNKTSLIDKLINNNKKLIKLLEEKRTALINKVITKGLDPNVKMKDSGIEWIGEIPEHWEVKKLKYLLEKNDSGVWGEEPSDMSGVRVLRSTEISINGKLINIERAAYRQLSKEEKLKSKLQKGDLLVTKSSGSKKHIGKTALMDSVVESEPTYFSNFMQLLRTNNQLLPRFCHLFLNSDITRYQYNLLANTTTGLANLNRRHFDNLTISVPPISEQIQISSYLDNKTSLIDKAIIKAKEENLMLKEYRQSLISNVITGKIDVRNN